MSGAGMGRMGGGRWRVAGCAMLLAALPATELRAEAPRVSDGDAAVDTARWLEESLIVRFGLGYDATMGSLSQQPDLLGRSPEGGDLRRRADWLTGELALGSRGLILPTLNTYVLGQGAFRLSPEIALMAPELGQAGPAPSVHPSVFDRFRDGRAWLFHLAYGELDGLGGEGLLQHAYLRAGRQSHQGIVQTYFDGVRLGYRGPQTTVLVFGGRRSGVFDRLQVDPGLVGGIDARVSLYRRGDTELVLDGGLLHFRRDAELDAVRASLAPERWRQRTSLGELRLRYDVGREGSATARVVYVHPRLSHIVLDGDYQFGPLRTTWTLSHRRSTRLFFDLAGFAAESGARYRPGEAQRLNIPLPPSFTELGTRWVLDLSPMWSLQFAPGFRKIHGAATERSGFDRDWIYGGVGVSARVFLSNESALEGDLDYELSRFLRPATGLFAGPEAGGESWMHEVALRVAYLRGTRYVGRRLLGGRTWKAELAGFLRTTRLRTAYVDGFSESIGGPRAELFWQVSRLISLRLRYEYALDSNAVWPHLGGFHWAQVRWAGTF